MRILHTSDWHVGVLLGGKERTQEHFDFLQELCDIIREEKIEAVLISGDIFDTPNPPAVSEKLVFDFFRKMAESRVPVILIAGNHDSGARIEGKSRLLELVEVYAFGKPQKSAAVEITTRSKSREKLVVAALPFCGDLRLLDPDNAMTQDQGQQRSAFAERMREFLSILARGNFKPGAVNVLMAHLTVEGAILSGSEKSIRMSDAWTIPASMFPQNADYVALGHIHKAQQFEYDGKVCQTSCSGRIAYPGSPLCVDFGEEKDEKGVYIIEAAAHQPPQVRFRRLEKITELKTIRTTLKEFQKEAAMFRDFKGHIKMMVRLEEEDKRTRVAEEVRKLLPQTIIVQVEAPKPLRKALPSSAAVTQHPLKAYELYLESQNRKATSELLETFRGLMEEVTDASPHT